jgi:hypothetical protein
MRRRPASSLGACICEPESRLRKLFPRARDLAFDDAGQADLNLALDIGPGASMLPVVPMPVEGAARGSARSPVTHRGQRRLGMHPAVSAAVVNSIEPWIAEFLGLCAVPRRRSAPCACRGTSCSAFTLRWRADADRAQWRPAGREALGWTLLPDETGGLFTPGQEGHT